MSMNDNPIPREDHDSWFTKTFPTMRDRMVIVEWAGRSVGWYQIESWEESSRSGEWGNAIGEPEATPIGLGGGLPLLALSHAFDRMQAVQMIGRVLTLNRNMNAIMRRLKVPVDEDLAAVVRRMDGSESSVTAYRVDRPTWPRIEATGLSLLPSSLRQSFVQCLSEPISE